MLRFLVLGVAVMALASPGQAAGPELFRRFMDLLGSNCGAFDCKRDVEVSRAVREYAEALRDTDEMMKRSEGEETADRVRDLHRRLASVASSEGDLVENVREQSRRLVEYARRALEERDAESPLEMAVRSIQEYADFSEREAEREETNEVRRSLLDLHQDLDDLKRRDEDQMEVRAPFEFARRAFEDKERMARAISDLYEALEE